MTMAEQTRMWRRRAIILWGIFGAFWIVVALVALV
jgi:hypothetical protein